MKDDDEDYTTPIEEVHYPPDAESNNVHYVYFDQQEHNPEGVLCMRTDQVTDKNVMVSQGTIYFLCYDNRDVNNMTFRIKGGGETIVKVAAAQPSCLTQDIKSVHALTAPKEKDEKFENRIKATQRKINNLKDPKKEGGWIKAHYYNLPEGIKISSAHFNDGKDGPRGLVPKKTMVAYFDGKPKKKKDTDQYMEEDDLTTEEKVEMVFVPAVRIRFAIKGTTETLDDDEEANNAGDKSEYDEIRERMARLRTDPPTDDEVEAEFEEEKSDKTRQPPGRHAKASASDALKKQQEAAAAAALKKQQEEEAAAAAFAWKKQQEEEAAAAAFALKKQQEEEAAAAELKKQQEELEAATRKKLADEAFQKAAEYANQLQNASAKPTFGLSIDDESKTEAEELEEERRGQFKPTVSHEEQNTSRMNKAQSRRENKKAKSLAQRRKRNMNKKNKQLLDSINEAESDLKQTVEEGQALLDEVSHH